MRAACYSLIALAGLALMPLAAASAATPPAGRSVVLRYHFAVGQTMAIRLTEVTHTSSYTTTAMMPVTATALLSGVIRDHITAVGPAGGATATVRVPPLMLHEVTASRTSTVPLPAQTAIVHINPDGSVQASSSSGATAFSYQIQSMSTLPIGAVAPGAHWTTTVRFATTNTAGISLPAVRVTVRSIFRGYKHLDGQRVAVISSSGPLQYLVNTVCWDGVSIFTPSAV